MFEKFFAEVSKYISFNFMYQNMHNLFDDIQNRRKDIEEIGKSNTDTKKKKILENLDDINKRKDIRKYRRISRYIKLLRNSSYANDALVQKKIQKIIGKEKQ